MPMHPVEAIRNLAFCGHKSCGKTTLVDRMLTHTGAVTRAASVDEGTSICDFDEEEKAHRYTVEAKVTHFDHAGKHFHVIDTPGYPDFIGQTIGALRGVDTAAIVINAQAGIEVNTRRVFAEAGKAGLGRMIVVNRMDAENIDFPKLMGAIKDLFGAVCVPLNVPIGQGAEFRGVASTLRPPADTTGALTDLHPISQSLIESMIVADEQVMERYFEGTEPSMDELARLMIRAIAEGSLIPIVFVSGKTGVGFPELLDAMAFCALPPDALGRKATGPGGEQVQLKADPEGPLVAQVFKTRIDPFVQKISFIRIYSGKLSKESTVPVVGVRKPVKLAQLYDIQASETEPIDEAGPGEIVVVTKTEELQTESSLGEYTMPPIPFPTPMVGLAASPKARGDETRLSGSLAKICQEDSTFRRELDMQTKEMVIYGVSELHLQIIRERLKRRDKVEIETKEPKIPYRETIQASATGSYRHKKQTGGRGQFGEVHIRMFPLPPNTNIEQYATKERFAEMKEYHYDPENNFLWIDSIVGASIPGNFMPAVEKGFRDRLERGVIAGYKIKDVCVEVFFGKHHPVDSSEQAFKTAASMAFRNVFQQAKPSLLEPIVRMEVTVPGDKLGDISSDLSGRRGRVLGMASAGGEFQTVTAEVPLAEVTTYARALSSMTGGQGSYTIEFSHYDLVPSNIQKEIIDRARMKEQEEE
ncbi:MAG: elongation factor G [Thermoguttaceae bacterium]